MKKMFPEAFDSRLDDFKKSLNGLSDNLDKLAQKRLAKSTLEGDISTLETRLTALKSELIGEAEIQIKNKALTETKEKVTDLKKQIDGLRASLKEELDLRLKTDDEALKKIKKDQEEIEARNASRKDFSGGGKTGRALRYKGKTESEWTKDTKDTEARSKALLAIKSYRDD
jgi:chromosome segregation ATPase